MALPFILFAIGAFVCVMTVKSSMNYDFGSNRRRTIIRSAVAIGTIAVVLIHSVIIIVALHAAVSAQDTYDPGVDLLVRLAAVVSGTLIWGFLVPKIVFSFVGRKPSSEIETYRNGGASSPARAHNQPDVPDSNERQTRWDDSQEYPWDKQETKRSNVPYVLLGAGALALAVVVAVVGIFVVFDSTPDQVAHGTCDTWLRQLLVNSPGATASTENANAAAAHVQSQRPKICPQDGWNPLVTDIASLSDGNITVSFATATGNARGTAVTLPEVDGTGWLYDANTQTWGTLPSTLGSSVIQESPTECDALLQLALHASTAANAASGNSAIATVREDGPTICSSNQWRPKIDAMERDYIGNIEVLFSPNSDGVTRPADGSLRWTYTVDDGNWRPADFSVPSVLATHPLAMGQPTQLAVVPATQTPPAPGNRTIAPTVDPGDYHELGNRERFNDFAFSEIERGRSLHDAGNYRGAISAYESAQAYHGQPSAVLENHMGLAFQAMGDHEKAIAHFTESLELNDGPVDRINRAASYAETAQCPLAIHDAQQALTMKSEKTEGIHTGAEAHHTIALCNMESGDYDQSIHHMMLALPLMQEHGYNDSEIADNLGAIGELHFHADRTPEAIQYYSQSISIIDTAGARANRAWAHVEQKNCDSATVDSQAALRLPPTIEAGYHSSAEAHTVLGRCKRQAGAYTQSTEHYIAAAELMQEHAYGKPETAAFVEGIGGTFALAEDYQGAIEYYTQSIAIHDNARTRAQRAWSYSEILECGKAFEDANAALLMPAVSWDGYHSSADAHDAIAICHLENGEWELGIDHMEKMLDLMRANSYDADYIKAMETSIKSLRGR